MINRSPRLFPALTTSDNSMQIAAKQILLLIMNYSANKIDAKLKRLALKYGDVFWQLILTKTSGIEAHNNKQWLDISPIEFAVCAGDFSDEGEHGYILNRLLAYIPIEHRSEALIKIKNMKELGIMHDGIKRGLLSEFATLDQAYTLCADYYNNKSYEEFTIYWKRIVVSAQLSLPMNGLREFCRPILWCDVSVQIPDFKNLPAPPDAKIEGGKSPFSQKGLCEGWGLFHYTYAASARRGGLDGKDDDTRMSDRAVLHDRDYLREYCKVKTAQLDRLIDQQERLIHEHHVSYGVR